MTESLMLALGGTGVGIGIASGVLSWFRAVNPIELPPGSVVRVDWKILLVTQHYAPFPSTTSGYMTEIAEELAQDCDVTVLSGTPDSNSKALSKPLFPAIIEIKSWWPGKSALVSRSLAAILFAFQVFFAVLNHARRDHDRL